MACRALSQRNNDPTKASRPWDTVSLLIHLLLSFFFFVFLFSSSTSLETIFQTSCF